MILLSVSVNKYVNNSIYPQLWINMCITCLIFLNIYLVFYILLSEIGRLLTVNNICIYIILNTVDNYIMIMLSTETVNMLLTFLTLSR